MPSASTQLGSLIERDETPTTDSQANIDEVLSTPNGPPESSLRDRIAQLSSIKTPNTLARPSREDMHPETAHQTTTGPPNDAAELGITLGMTDITNGKKSIASLQNSPTRSEPRSRLPQVLSSAMSRPLTSPTFEFKFASSTHLSNEAQKLMDNVREDAARIKAQMLAEKQEQERKDEEVDQIFGGYSAAGRKIAEPKGKAGRFSDIHMEQFKKMDSIANHPSSFRAKPVFAQPTQQSLKRSGSRAGLDEPERPRTAGKGTPGKPAPPFMRQASASPFKSVCITKPTSDRLENTSPAKRMRQSEFGDVSSGIALASDAQYNSVKPSTGLPSKLARPRSIFAPTAASLSRFTSTKMPKLSPDKTSQLDRSNSVKSLKNAFEAVRSETTDTPAPPLTAPFSRLPRSDSMRSMRPLPSLPIASTIDSPPSKSLTRAPSTNLLSARTPKTGFSSRLPTFAGLKSILRPSRASPSKHVGITTGLDPAGGTPKRTNTAMTTPGSAKRVDFTPSTKSRYAVKLAAASPTPSKMFIEAGYASSHSRQLATYDPAAYTVEDMNDDKEEETEEDWEDAESDVAHPSLPPAYPTLPSAVSPTSPAAPVVNTFAEKAKQHNRRESKEFKSIFVTLEHPSRPTPAGAITLTDVNTRVNQTNPVIYANKVMRSPSSTRLSKPSPSTIRRVRTSGVSELVQPFEDEGIKTVPHGLPGKKRRRKSEKDHDLHDNDDDSKENRKHSVMPSVPGGWDVTAIDEDGEEDEGEQRGRKRAKVAKPEVEEPKEEMKNGGKKINAAREAAAKNAKERKGKGILSLNRLNMLARPKDRK